MALSRAVRTGSNLVAAIGAAVALFAIANIAGAKFWTQWDWSHGGLFSLCAQSKTIVAGLERDVHIVSFLGRSGGPGQEALDQIDVLLDAYVAANPKRVSLEAVDARRDPLRAEALLKEFAIDPRGAAVDVVVVQSGSRNKQVRLTDMLEFEASSDPSAPPAVKSVKAEDVITDAILAVTRARQPLVRFATGHGEREQTAGDDAGLSNFVEALARQDVKVETWDALGAKEVPAPTDLLIVAGPTAPWLPPERDALRAYLDKGGRAMVLLDPVLQQGAPALVTTGLEPVLEAWGVRPEATIVIDPRRSVPFFGAETFYADALGLHPVTSALGGRQVLFVMARSLATTSPAPAGITVHSLFETTADAWAESDLSTLDKGVAKGPGDRGGPFPVALAAEKKEGSPQGRLLVVGDADFLANLALDQLANRSFALNAVAWMTDENRALGIQPKERATAKLFLTDQQSFALFLLLVLALPGIAIAAGLTVWWRRKRA